ncbi:lactate/malate dehydrogenase, NAD binding domain protein [Ostertagia ostertagi]
MAATVNEVFEEIAPVASTAHGKVTVVGVGQVGMACAYSILQQNIANEICLVDVVADKLKGEMMDLQHGLAFTRHCVVKADTDYAITAGSKICVITAGARQREGESRLSLVQRKCGDLQRDRSKACSLFTQHNPHVDVLTYVTWKISGLPKERVFGSGTNLDSEDSASCSHRSCTSLHLHAMDGLSENMEILAEQLMTSIGSRRFTRKSWKAHIEIIKLKGYTSWAIGLSVAKIVQAIMTNSRNVFALSTNVKGFHGIAEEVYLSLPVVLGSECIRHIVKKQNLELGVKSQH